MAVAVAPKKLEIFEEVIGGKPIKVRLYFENKRDELAEFLTLPHVKQHDIQLANLTRKLKEKFNPNADTLDEIERLKDEYSLLWEAGFEVKARGKLRIMARKVYGVIHRSQNGDDEGALARDFGRKLAG